MKRALFSFFIGFCIGLVLVPAYGAEVEKVVPKAIDEAAEDMDAKIIEEAAQEVGLGATAQPEAAVQAKSEKEIAEAKQKESDVPLFKKQAGQEKVVESSANKLIFTAIIVSLLGIGLTFAIRRWGKNKSQSKSNTSIKVLTQHYLGPKKSLAIIQVAGESILIGVTEQNISMIKSLALLDEEMSEVTEKSFKRALDDFDEREEFALRGVKDVVSNRLKGMRSLE